MSNARDKSFVSLVVPHRTDRQVLHDLARGLDTLAAEQHITRHEVQRIGTHIAHIDESLAELSGHVARADAVAHKASSHDLTQDAKLAELHEKVGSLHRAGVAVQSFLEHETTKQIVKIAFVVAAAYAAGKGVRLLP
jgi:hypothetical protein